MVLLALTQTATKKVRVKTLCTKAVQGQGISIRRRYTSEACIVSVTSTGFCQLRREDFN